VNAAANILHAQLDAPLPAELAAGGATAIFVAATCFSPAAATESVVLVVDGEEQPLLAFGMPRLDVVRALEVPTSYRSGCWGIARVRAHEAGDACTLALRARLADGTVAEAALARIPVVALPDPLPAPATPGSEPLVAISMATYNPPAELLHRQLDSIRAQSHTRWTCVISDDCSDPEHFAVLLEAVGDDPRFVVERSERRRGFYRNFERALALTPREADYVALADQDDAWHPDKLATLLDALDGGRLVYSDARIIRPDGEVLSDTYWTERRNNHRDILSLLVANAVTGAASLFPRDLLDAALPFPPAQFQHFHDHWIALCALAQGDIRFVPRPLYDYVQHGSATIGHAAANRMPSMRDRFETFRRDPRDRIRWWRLHYFVDACRMEHLIAMLRLRCGDALSGRKRRALDRFVRAERSPLAIVPLAVRGARELAWRRRMETLGAEWMLAHAFAWRQMLERTTRDRPQRRLRLDAVPPSVLDPPPSMPGPGDPALRRVADRIRPLRLAVRDDAPGRVNVLVPRIELRAPEPGQLAALALAGRLARRGARVRIVTVDAVGPLPYAWQSELERVAGLPGLFSAVEAAFGRESPGLEVSRGDAWVATAWWTAHVAHAALAHLGPERFVYLIDDYAPLAHPMGSLAALAEQSYHLPHAALFSTELLRAHFRRRALGVYAGGAAAGDAASAAFEPPVPAIGATNGARGGRRLLFHGRPDDPDARNMVELGVLALSRAIARGALAGWTVRGVGTVGAGRRVDLAAARRVDLGGGASMQLVPHTTPEAFARMLTEHDVGFALRYGPHPGPMPLAMASAGLLTVTNAFEDKTAESLAAISPNLIAAEAGVDSLADALAGAAEAVGARRAGGARRWNHSWDEALDDALMERVEGLLGSG
jgi:glycosyltransferase involved in cell wall biosynthesis